MLSSVMLIPNLNTLILDVIPLDLFTEHLLDVIPLDVIRAPRIERLEVFEFLRNDISIETFSRKGVWKA